MGEDKERGYLFVPYKEDLLAIVPQGGFSEKLWNAIRNIGGVWDDCILTQRMQLMQDPELLEKIDRDIERTLTENLGWNAKRIAAFLRSKAGLEYFKIIPDQEGVGATISWKRPPK